MDKEGLEYDEEINKDEQGDDTGKQSEKGNEESEGKQR